MLGELVDHVIGVDPDRDWITVAALDARTSGVLATDRFAKPPGTVPSPTPSTPSAPHVRHHHGTVVKHTGDGALAAFPSGSEAVAAAVELRNVTKDLGLEGRTGLHVGEVEQRGDDIGGIAVHLAARVATEITRQRAPGSPSR